MFVKMLTLAAGPEGTKRPGQVCQVSGAEGKALLATRAAVECTRTGERVIQTAASPKRAAAETAAAPKPPAAATPPAGRGTHAVRPPKGKGNSADATANHKPAGS